MDGFTDPLTIFDAKRVSWFAEHGCVLGHRKTNEKICKTAFELVSRLFLDLETHIPLHISIPYYKTALNLNIQNYKLRA
jgi:hypothetical protein